MNIFRYLIRIFLLLFFTAFCSIQAFAFPSEWQQIQFSTVSDTIIIQNSEGNELDVAGLNRDEAQAHETLDKIFDLQEIKDEQEYVKIASEVMGRAMEPVIQKIGEAYHGGEISGAEQKMAHAIIGCITGGVVNGECASGAVGAVAAEFAAEAYLKSAVLDAYEKGELTEERYNEIRKQAILTGQIAGGIAGASIGGDVGIASEAGKRAAENNAAPAIAAACAASGACEAAVAGAYATGAAILAYLGIIVVEDALLDDTSTPLLNEEANEQTEDEGKKSDDQADRQGREEGRKPKLDKADSPVWKDLKPHRGKTKTNGEKGKKKRYYEWDHKHGDIEVYDSNGDHMGSANPETGKIYKPPVPGRNIKKNL